MKPKTRLLTARNIERAWFVALLVIPAIFFFWFMNSAAFELVKISVVQHLPLLIAFIFTFKVIGIVFPAIPGNFFTLAGIAFLGWPLAYAIDFLASIVGVSIDYYLGKKYGLKFIVFLLGERIGQKIKNLRIKKNREVESVFVMKIFGAGFVGDAICYAAGFLRVKYRHFLAGHILSHVLAGIPTFFVLSDLIETRNIGLPILFFVGGILLLYLFRNRYLEEKS